MASKRMVVWSASSCSTYRQGNFATLGNLLGEDSHEVENGGMALGTVTESVDDRGKDVIPILHLDSEDGQANAKLYPDRLRPH